MKEIGQPVPESTTVEDVEKCLFVCAKNWLSHHCASRLHYGWNGGGIVDNEVDLISVVTRGLKYSMIGQVLIERSVAGWKEIEYEVIRDAADNCIVVCNMENFGSSRYPYRG